MHHQLKMVNHLVKCVQRALSLWHMVSVMPDLSSYTTALFG